MKLTLTCGDETRHLRVLRAGSRLTVTFEDGREVTVRLLADGQGRFELEHGHTRVHGAGIVQGSDRQLWINGRNFSYSCRMRRASREAGAPASLASPLPATVVDVLVAPGEQVRAGQKLALLESMKMVTPIQAPRDGKVTRVACSAGDSVAAGEPLFEFE